jgi:hypothetical protein
LDALFLSTHQIVEILRIELRAKLSGSDSIQEHSNQIPQNDRKIDEVAEKSPQQQLKVTRQ